jgi:N-acetylneuraminate synthase
MARVSIGDRTLGGANPAFIVAEVGINHDGKLDRALEMIRVAAGAGADCVKFQLFRAAGTYQPRAGTYHPASGGAVAIYDLMEAMEMPVDWIPRLMEACRGEGVQFLTSVCDETVLAALDPWPMPAFKVASYEISHLPLFRALGRRGRPVILSTGAAQLGDIEEALAALGSGGKAPALLLHCVASYPTPPEHCNLEVIRTLGQAFPDCVVGYSDHSADPVRAPMQAVALGAKLIEKHFTLDRSRPGPDHGFAVDPAGLGAMVRAIRATEADLRAGHPAPPDPPLLGSGARITQDLEAALRRFAYRTLFAAADIPAGSVIGADQVAVLRCGEGMPGLHPRHYDLVTSGRVKATRTVPAHAPITWDCLLNLV